MPNNFEDNIKKNKDITNFTCKRIFKTQKILILRSEIFSVVPRNSVYDDPIEISKIFEIYFEDQ